MTWLERSRPLKRSKPMARSRIKRKPPRRIAEETPEERLYKQWIHGQPCVGVMFTSYPVHHCQGRIEQSHERDMTGLGLKAPNRRSIAMCTGLHREWEQRYGWFLHWDNNDRREFMRDRIAEANARFDAEHTAATTPGFSSVPVEPLPPCEACEGEGCDKCF